MSEPPREGHARRILEEGVTCWRIAQAERVAVLIDGAAYYQALLEALPRARRLIMIRGWDFDPTVRLDPSDPATELRRLLPVLVERSPDLHIYLLIWDVSVVYGPSSPIELLFDRTWQAHSRIHFRFDSNHPFGAAHHEKLVCIDDALAFAGGIDLTVQRWDTPAHDPTDPRCVDPSGARYDPVHDLQIAVSGEAAAALAELTRTSWAEATGETPPPPAVGTGDPWPPSLTPRLSDVPVAIARTRPAMDGRPGVHEVAALNAAALTAARRSVYIEAQYLSAPSVADRLAALLERPGGPEIVLLIWHNATGWLERVAMGGNRDRLLRRLAAADREGRLRAYWLALPREPAVEINLHAKLIIIDDVFVRIGSSNLNNRSLGVDTECDLAIEAADPTTRAAIARLRDELLAEHLERTPDEVTQAIARHGLIGAIERLNAGGGRLRPYRINANDGPKEPFPGTALLDPEEPLDLDYLARALRDGLFSD